MTAEPRVREPEAGSRAGGRERGCNLCFLVLFVCFSLQVVALAPAQENPPAPQYPDTQVQDGRPLDRRLPPGVRLPPGMRQRLQVERNLPAPEQASPPAQAQAPAAPIVSPPPQIVSPGSQPAGPSLKVEYAAGRLSVTADRVPLSQVFQEVGRRTGLEVRGLSEVSQQASIQFSNVAVGDAVRNLLGGINYALFGKLNSPEGVSRARVVILSATAGATIDVGTQAQAGKSAASQAERNVWRAHLMSTNPAEQDAGFREVVKLGPKDAYDALEDVIVNGDGVARLRALQFMDQDGDIDQGMVMGALKEALNDQDSGLRDYAVQAIGRHPGSESIDLLHQVYNDGDAAQRLSVLESISQRTDAKGIIQQAASDPDQAVSGLATELLNNAAAPNQ